MWGLFLSPWMECQHSCSIRMLSTYIHVGNLAKGQEVRSDVIHVRSNTLKKIFVGSLAPTTTEESLQALFAQYGKVRSIKVAKDIFTGQCKGFGFIEMEGHEARAAISELHGKSFEGRNLKVSFEEKRGNGPKGRHR